MWVKTTKFLKIQMDLIFPRHLSPFLHTPLNLIKTTLKQITTSLAQSPKSLILVGISQTSLRTVWVVALASGEFL